MTDKDNAAIEEESAADTEGPASEENPNRAERVDDRNRWAQDKQQAKDTRSILKAAFKEHGGEKSEAKSEVAKAKPRAEDGKFSASQENKGAVEKPAKEAAASPAPKPIPQAKESSETAAAVAPQAQSSAIAAPATAPKEVLALWDKLPQEAQAVFAKREADMLKGVEKIQSELKPIKDAFAPVMGQLQQLGKTPAEATQQLLAWQAALANPRTQAEAFRALARAHNFDISTLIAPSPNGATPNQASQPQAPDPVIAVRQYLDPLANKVQALESEYQRQARERVESDIRTFSKDKPHFEQVKVAMGHLMQSGLAQGDTPKEAFDKAYEMACRADQEVFNLIQQEEQAKREAEAKAQAEAAAKKAADEAEAKRKREAEEVARARRAAVGPRSGSPVGMAQANRSAKQSVRDTLREALREHSGAI